jgi:hypothetical protein
VVLSSLDAAWQQGDGASAVFFGAVMRTRILYALLPIGLLWQTAGAADLPTPTRKPEPAPVVAASDESKFTPPQAAADPARLGTGVQRTMALLKSSTPEHHNKLRIVFYGQSITEQDWTKAVSADLRKRFPNADLEIENRAIGGFASQMLVRPVVHDIYPYYPDLVIFHVYGSHINYEEIIQGIRSHTTAEVLMQTDHITSWPKADKVDHTKDLGPQWDTFMNTEFLPDTAKKYGCGLADIHTDWLAYLKGNQLEPKALLVDGVHLNAHGNYLMANLIERHLVFRADLQPAADAKEIQDLVVGKDIQWKDGALSATFTGNRVDAIYGVGPAQGAADVLVDGKRPSEFAGCYYITRPSPGPWTPLFLSRVDHDQPLVVENWTYKVTSVDAGSKKWSFEVSGSVTGADGSGSSDKPFVSKSGRVRIDPKDYFRGHNAPLPADYVVTWSVKPTFVDRYAPAASTDKTRDGQITLAQGIPNAPHTLELKAADGATPRLLALRVYQPPVAEAPAAK